MRVIESNEVSQRAHGCVRERGEVIRDLGSKFIQQRGKLVAVVSQYVASVSLNEFRAETRHHAQSVFGECDRQFIAGNAAAVVAVVEKANVAPDSLSVQRTALKKWRVIGLRRLHDAEQNRDVGDRTRHRPSSV